MRPPGFNQPNPQVSRPNQGYNANQGYNGNRNVNQTNQVNHGVNSGFTQQAQAYQVPSAPAPVTYSSCDTCPTISYDNCETVKRIDLIDATCAEYAPQVLDFTKSGDSTSIILDPPPFTPFEGSEMLLEEEIDKFLENDESLNMDLNNDFNDEEGDMVYLESLLEVLNDDPFS
ncbi:hypothetical protein Tco_1539149 [Tanacetum coccineum]